MKRELSKAYGEITPRFHARVERTLDEIISKEELPMKRFAYRTACIVMAVLVALTGAALALGSALGLLDFFSANNGLIPTEGAQGSITKGICSAEAGQLLYTLREAVYDGASVRTLIEVAPLNPDEYIVGQYNAGETRSEGAETDEELARRTGRKILKTGYPDLDYNGDKEEYMSLEMGIDTVIAYRDGDNLLIYTETTVVNIGVGDTPEELALRYSIVADTYNVYADLPFTLTKCALNRAEYAPSGEDIPDINVTGVSIVQTPFADYLNVTYEFVYNIAPLDYQPDTVYYGTPNGLCVHTDPKCSGMTNAQPMTEEEARATRKQLCTVCAGGANTKLAGEKWAFTRTDASDRLFTTGGDIMRVSTDMDIYSYTQTWIYQQGEPLPDSLKLSVLFENEPTGSIIQCERVK